MIQAYLTLERVMFLAQTLEAKLREVSREIVDMKMHITLVQLQRLPKKYRPDRTARQSERWRIRL